MAADHPHFVDLPQPLGRDGYVSGELAGMLHPDQARLKQQKFRSYRYSPLANGYSMLTLQDETGAYFLVFDDGGNPIPGVFENPGKAAGAAESDYEDRNPSGPPTSP